MNTLEAVKKLVENSFSLKKDPAEQWFWLAESKSMSEEGLLKLKTVLENEQREEARIRSGQDSKLAQIDADHLEALAAFKRVDMPKYVKQWESAQRAEENPDAILNQMN